MSVAAALVAVQVQRSQRMLVGEVPGAKFSRFESYQRVVRAPLGVRRSFGFAEIANGDSADRCVHSLTDESRPGAEFDAAVWGCVLVHDDARLWLSLHVPRLHIVPTGSDVEPARSPFVPDGREQDAPVPPMGREDGDQWQLEEIAEILDCEISPHPIVSLRLRGSEGASTDSRSP
jgi:hypothetical protein